MKIRPGLSQGSDAQERNENSHKSRSTSNRLDELSGRDWIKFTKSWFVHRPERRGELKVRHPASFPESLVRGFILFFTRRRHLVVDPFLGTGSTLVAAVNAGRSGVGFEIVDRYAKILRQRVTQALPANGTENGVDGEQPLLGEVVKADSASLSEVWKNRRFPADYCITTPRTGTN